MAGALEKKMLLFIWPLLRPVHAFYWRVRTRLGFGVTRGSISADDWEREYHRRDRDYDHVDY